MLHIARVQEGEPVLKPMSRGSSLRQRAEVAIRGGIITGEISPGQIYSAPALAKELGVSATPVREAMLDLAAEGLVESVPNRGFRVVPLLDGDLDEITEMRVLLEAPAVAALAARPDVLDEVQLARLRGRADEIERLAGKEDLPTFIDADRAFHLELLGLFGNRRLTDTVERLRNATRRYGMRRLDRGTLEANAHEHHQILDALAAGDRARVQALMEDHVRTNRGVLAGPARTVEPSG
jgi:DNA-binding GntR family transcriptional regulator